MTSKIAGAIAPSGRVMVRGAFLSSAGMLISMAGGMGAAMIYTRALSETEVGIFLLFILACDLVILFNNLGMRSAMPKLVAGATPNERATLVGSALAYQLLISLGIGLLVYLLWFVVRDPSALSENESWTGLFPYLWLLPFFFLVGTQRELAMAVMAGFNRYGRRTAGLVAAAATNVSLVALLVWWLEGGLLTLMLATLTSYVVAASWQYLGLPEGKRLRLHWPSYRGAVVFGFPLYLNNLLTFGFQRFDTILVAGLIGPIHVAYYEIAKRLPLLWARLFNSGLVPYLPGISRRIADGDMNGASRLLSQTASFAAVVSYSGALCMLVIQKPLILFLFSEKYLDSLAVLWVLLVGTCVAIQTGVMGQSLIALGKPGVVTKINVGTAVLSLGLNLILIPRLGMLGAAGAYLLAMAFSNSLQTWFALRNGFRLNVRHYLSVQLYMGLALCLSVCMGTAVWRLVALGLFVGLCLATGVVTPGHGKKLLSAFLPSRSTPPCESR